MTARPRQTSVTRTMLLLGGLCCAGGPWQASAQTLAELTSTPEAAAELFIRSLRTVRWSAAAQFIDPETLEQFRELVSMITEPDATGELLEYLTATDSAGFAALDAATVFDRALTALTMGMPGLTHSLVDRDDEVLGRVAEGADSAHVVYRTQMRIGGSVPEVNVMQMRAGPDGWRVLWSEELYVLQTALRGASRLRPRQRGGATDARPRARAGALPRQSWARPGRPGYARSTRPAPRVSSATAPSNAPTALAGTAHP